MLEWSGRPGPSGSGKRGWHRCALMRSVSFGDGLGEFTADGGERAVSVDA